MNWFEFAFVVGQFLIIVGVASVLVHEAMPILKRLDSRLGSIMAKVDELLAELQTANEVTNEIASDVEDLLAQLAGGGLSDAEAETVKAKIQELTERLRGVAAEHTPGGETTSTSPTA